jgi:hypothetical protein
MVAKVSQQYSSSNLTLKINTHTRLHGGPGYSVGIATDWLRAGRSGDRIPEGARFFAHVQIGPVVHPASCTMGTGSFPGVKRPGRGTDHPPPSSAEVESE